MLMFVICIIKMANLEDVQGIATIVARKIYLNSVPLVS